MKQISKVASCLLSATFVMAAYMPAASAKADSEQQQRVSPLTSNVQNFVQESLSQTFLKTSANTSATLPRIKNAAEEVADKDVHIGESEADYEFTQYYEEDITVASSNYVSTAVDFTPVREKNEEMNLEDIQLPNRVYSNVLKPGDESAEVVLLQQRLMRLGYMESDNPTGYYGSSTQNAIEMFQRANDIAIDGVAGRETLDLIFSGNAKTYTIRPGDKGNDIRNIQNRLMELTYYWGAHNGTYDDKTVEAMKLFQNKNGLYDDGIIGLQTFEKLFSADAIEGNVPKPTPTPTPTPKPVSKPASVSNGGGSGGGGGKVSNGGGGNSSSSNSSGNTTAPSTDGETVDPNTVDPNTDVPQDGQDSGNTAPEPEAPATEPEVSIPEPEAPAQEPEDNGSSDSGNSSSGENTSTPKPEVAPTPKPEATATPIPSKEPEKTTTSTGNGNSSSGSDNGSSSAAEGSVSRFIEVANAQSGKPYKLGGNGPNSFDCSGFVYYSLNNSGKKVPRLSAAGYYSYGWTSVSRDNLQVGDLLFFKKDGGSSIGHVGIYVGGNKMIHASTSEGKILTTNLSQAYWVRNYAGARRVF